MKKAILGLAIFMLYASQAFGFQSYAPPTSGPPVGGDGWLCFPPVTIILGFIILLAILAGFAILLGCLNSPLAWAKPLSWLDDPASLPGHDSILEKPICCVPILIVLTTLTIYFSWSGAIAIIQLFLPINNLIKLVTLFCVLIFYGSLTFCYWRFYNSDFSAIKKPLWSGLTLLGLLFVSGIIRQFI